MDNVDKYLVLVAGGSGTRMGAGTPKQYLPLLGKPLLCHAIDAFSDAVPDIKIILVLPAAEHTAAEDMLQPFIQDKDIQIVQGGETRFHSVQNGLNAIKGNGIVSVHDGARPVVPAGLIQRCLAQAIRQGSAIPAIPVAESIRRLSGESSVPIDRNDLRIIQTPQTFRTEILLPAYLQPYSPSFTDEATVAEAYGAKVHLIAGEPGNIKVTTPADMAIAAALLQQQNEI